MMLSEAFTHFIQHSAPPSEKEVYLCARFILDIVGTVVLNSRIGVMERAAQVTPRAGKATLAGAGGGFSTRDVAFLNGINGHRLELNDTSSSNLGYPTVVVLPALPTLGEKSNSLGEEPIRVFVVATGMERKLGRLCAHVLHEWGWHASNATDIVEAAAGAAYLSKLKEEELVDCLGIAVSMAVGMRENFGIDTKSLHIGKAAADGLLAVCLTREGCTASSSALDGREGYFYEYSRLHFDLFGSDWYKTPGNRYDVYTPGSAIRQYPPCNSTRRAMDAFVDLARIHCSQPEGIAPIRAELSTVALRELVTPKPRTGDEARSSVGFQVTLYLGGLDNIPNNYIEKIIFRPDIQRIIKTTHLCRTERYDALSVDMRVGPTLVSVTPLDDTEYHIERIYPVGHRIDSVSDQTLEEKLLCCTCPALSKEQACVLRRTLWELKDDAVANLTRQTVPTLQWPESPGSSWAGGSDIPRII